MMQPLWLDYQRAWPGQRLPGTLLLGAGLLAAGLLFGYFGQLVDASEAAREDITRLKRAAEQPERDAAARSSAATTSTTARGARPGVQPANLRSASQWESLFTSLEAAGDKDVTLLSLQPGNGGVVITGEAADHDASLDYLTRLQSSPVLSEVHLTSSEVLVEHPQRPLRFTLAAAWRGGAR